MERLFSAPTMINLELTEICNVKCSHCYNYWRDESIGQASFDVEKIDALVKKFVESGIFHVVVTGGEPMAQFDLLEYTLKKLQEHNISVSCNSNLTLATEARVQRLLDVGLDHILTSMPSYDAVTIDTIMNKVGAFEKIVQGIKNSTKLGMRVSANMVITRRNMHQVYETGKFVAELGCQKLFVTRSVPPTYSEESDLSDYDFTSEEYKHILDEAIRVRDDFGIMIGSLVSYPLCFLGDLEKYKDFVGRGCPSQSGHRMSVNANGESHACVHEEEAYGSIFDKSIEEIYQGKMRRWHDRSFVYEGCAGCEYDKVCTSGCSMMALGHYGKHNAKDPLFVGPEGIHNHFNLVVDPGVYDKIKKGLRFRVPERIRFRKEAGFHLLNIRWANTISIDDGVAGFLMRYQKSGKPFGLKEFGEDNLELLTLLFLKDAIEMEDGAIDHGDQRHLQGMSINIDDLPQFAA